MGQNRVLVVLVTMLLTLVVFIPSYQAPNTNSPIENWDDCIVLINESFENGFPPENWTNTGWLDSLYGEPYHGDHWAYSWTAGDALTTPPLEFGVNTTLTFWFRAESSTHPECLEVYVNETLFWSDYGFTHDNYEMETVYLDSLSGLKTIKFGTNTGDFYGTLVDLVTVTTLYEDVNQSVQDRGFPIRHAQDGDWAGAQNFTPTYNTLAYTEIYLRKFGTPEFNLTVELRENHPQGTLIDTLIFIPEEVTSSWEWFQLNFDDTTAVLDTNLFIVIPPAPSGVTTSFGYEWGYAWGNQYDDGAFWFTRDGGELWRDLPTMYEFCFRTYGYN
jgi:hypothetical protein